MLIYKKNVRAKFHFCLFCFSRQILPYFCEMQKASNSNGFRDAHKPVYCECYHSIDTELNEAIFLEDLNVQNFYMLDHRK